MEIIRGIPSNEVAADRLIKEIEKLGAKEGTLYVGYPIVATHPEPVVLDAVLCCKKYGLVIFDLETVPATGDTADWEKIAEKHFSWRLSIKGKFIKDARLVDRATADLKFAITIASYCPEGTRPKCNVVICEEGKIGKLFKGIKPVSLELENAIQSNIQNLSRLRMRPSKKGVTQGSKKQIIQSIDKEISYLDRWQKKAAIECPDGEQRIRGIAGSGKTIVLALKAAYLHAIHPEWKIAVTFYTRTLYQQIRSLVTKFYMEYSDTEPDWTNLLIMHAWGSSSRGHGIYSYIANLHGQGIEDFMTASAKHGKSAAFDGVCDTLEKNIRKNPKQVFDAVLVDEAQDLPPAFLRLCHMTLKEPKRLVWAYDELQNLSNRQMPSLSELFGLDAEKKLVVTLSKSTKWPAQQDVILPVCYRNTPWALATGHAFGFGVYAKRLVQYFGDEDLWKDIGYEVEDGQLKPGEKVCLKRSDRCTPEFFKQKIRPDDAVVLKRFGNRIEESEWVAENIQKNIKEDELDEKDILVVFPDARSVQDMSQPLRDELRKRGVHAHIAGVASSVDTLFEDNSVAISSIYRAKGNEAPMVYVMNSDFCADLNLIKRNVLFTAITRSKAWVRISGNGAGMDQIEKEMKSIVSNDFHLRFTAPTEAELARMRMIQRDRSESELKRLNKQKRDLREVVESMESGDLMLEDIPEDIRVKLESIFKQS